MMDNTGFLKLVNDAGILNNVVEADLPAFSKRELEYSALGEVNVDGKQLKFCIAASIQFPRQNPIIFFVNHEEFEIVPHVEDDGMICYVQEDAIVLDIDNPIGIIRECFQMAISNLRDGFLKNNEQDFYNEYEAYWRRFKNITPVFTAISISDKVTVLRYAKFPNKDVLFACNEDEESIKIFDRLFISENKSKLPHTFQGVFIPLEKGSKIFIPRGNAELTTNHLQNLIVHHVSQENKKRLTALLTNTKREDLLIFSLPQPNGYYSLFGVRIKSIDFSKHPLFSLDTTVNLIPLSVSRLDPQYMLARGGTGQGYLDKKVLVIGGGSVGGYICDELIKASIINIDVVDKDDLSPDNCYRHVCGFTNVLMNKSIAIKKKLESFYPHAKVNAIDSSIENAYQNGKVKLDAYNAIIVATGNATLNQYLNRVFRKETPNTPVLYSWLDPFGIGGHCLVTNITEQGCFQCLYSNDDLYNIASFADRVQSKSFSRNIAGCGTTYVPYGSLDAMQTALLSVRQLLGIFNKQLIQNSINSWKGNADLFLAEGYKLSPRFLQNCEELEQVKHLFYQSNCAVCGNRKDI